MAKKVSWRKVTTIYSFKDAKTVRVFGIARVSTDKQAQKIGESLDHQKEVLNNWVRSKSSLHSPQEWKLVDIFVENESLDGQRKGRTATKREGRKGLTKALELAKLKLIDVVVVTKLDRLARNTRDYIDISAEFNENEVALVCLDLDIDTSTPDGQMIMRNHANLAQWQAERISQYSLETVLRHLNQGRPIGPPPVGYKTSKDANDKTTYVPDQVYRKHVEFIDQLYLRVKSVIKVVDILHQKGYKSRHGKTYSKPQVSRILQNIRYIAKQEHDGQIYPGNWTPLRAEDVHKTIQAILRRNRATNHSPNSSNRNYVYLVKSLLKCSNCGSTMIARPATGKGGKYYPYYMCMKAFKTNGIDCSETNLLAADTTDDAIVEVLRHLHLNPDNVAEIVKKANQATASTIGILEEDLDRVQERLKDIRTKIANLVDILTDKGLSGVDAVKERLETLNQDELELVVEENRIKSEIQAENIQAGTAHDYIKTLQLFEDFYRMNKNKRERIQAILPRIINSVICEITDKKKGIGKLKIGLFGRPFNRGENAEIWNKTLQNIADECYNNKALEEINGKFGTKAYKERESSGSGGTSLATSDKRFYNNLVFAGGKNADPNSLSALFGGKKMEFLIGACSKFLYFVHQRTPCPLTTPSSG
ncbi:MAG: recombinase family protein, partial [Candidatus Omnitrophica bacterium]|nr:recombinase family protein [Candidatus Omnitrophota bacterium]